jgi:predicted Zn-dependent peptidase
LLTFFLITASEDTVPDTLVKNHRFPNGLVLIAETMPGVQSAAFTILLPAGAAFEPAGSGGTAAMLAEWIMRGAGERDSRELLSALDNLGVSHGEGAQTSHTGVSGVTLSRNLIPALRVFADVLLRPHLDDEEIEPIRDLTLQSLQSLEDDPSSKVIYELRKRHFPDPWGRPTPGSPEGVQSATPQQLREFHQDAYRPNGTIIAVAGAIDWPALLEAVETLFSGWERRPEPPVQIRASGPKRDHLLKDTQQIQIALAFPSEIATSPHYYLARAAVAILGGYPSARLFTEVREKRGLCYSVYAGYEGLKDRAAVLCYAGTSADRAQETLDVTLAEMSRLRESGIDAEELEMMRAGLKSSLIMQQESTMSRSGSLAADWYHLGRTRSIEEISRELDALTPGGVSAFAARLPLDDVTLLTLGPNALEVSDGRLVGAKANP